MANHAHEVDIVKNDARSYTVFCVHCGDNFEATRSDAAFCSPSCRVGYRRAEKKRLEEIAMIESYGRAIRALSEKHKYSEKAYQAALKAQHEVMQAVNTFEERPGRLPGF